MRDTLEKVNGYGCAAIHVGILRRAVVVLDKSGVIELINPKVSEVGTETQTVLEGSIAPGAPRGYVIRPKIGKQAGDIINVTIEEATPMEKEKRPVVVPEELIAVMETDNEAKEFFESLTDGYKRGYCDWVGGAKQAAARQTRADKALVMLQNKQKTLKT